MDSIQLHDGLYDALEPLLTSVAEPDKTGGVANVVDGLFAIARALEDVARAIRTASVKNGKGER